MRDMSRRTGATTSKKVARLVLCCFSLPHAHRLVVVAEHRTARRRVPLPLLFEVVPVEVVCAHCTGTAARARAEGSRGHALACVSAWGSEARAGEGGRRHKRTKWRGARELALRHDDLLCCCGPVQHHQHSGAEQQRCDARSARHDLFAGFFERGARTKTGGTDGPPPVICDGSAEPPPAASSQNRNQNVRLTPACTAPHGGCVRGGRSLLTIVASRRACGSRGRAGAARARFFDARRRSRLSCVCNDRARLMCVVGACAQVLPAEDDYAAAVRGGQRLRRAQDLGYPSGETRRALTLPPRRPRSREYGQAPCNEREPARAVAAAAC